MAKWRKTCTEFNDVRELITGDGANEEIIEGLIKICDKYIYEEDEFADDFESLKDDLFAVVDECDADTVDFYLSEFYDLCDAVRIWLDF